LGRIGEKRYFKIGEVSKLTGLEPHTIRYWESEFPQLRPLRVGSKQRLYRPQDLDLLKAIQQLVHQEKYTIAGARLQLAQAPPAPAGPEEAPSLWPDLDKPAAESGALLAEIGQELRDILKVLS